MSIFAASENAIEVVITENDIEVVTENDNEELSEIEIEVASETAVNVIPETAINVIPENSIEWMKPKKRKKLRKLLPARKPQKVIGISYDSKYILNNHCTGRKNWKKLYFP